jgi:LDH2 family malate/lactate/ureidoglycolate dehydrogenase
MNIARKFFKVSSNFCMDLAMKKAKETGIGWISCHGKIHTIPIEKIFTKSATFSCVGLRNEALQKF